MASYGTARGRFGTKHPIMLLIDHKNLKKSLRVSARTSLTQPTPRLAPDTWWPMTPSQSSRKATGGLAWRFIVGCADRTIAKTPCHLPTGKLLPLPVPQQPWSHLRVGFVTDLPSSKGKTYILFVVDRLPQLLSARGYHIRLQTAAHLPVLVSLSSAARCNCKPLFCIPFPDKWANRAESPGWKPIPANLLPVPSAWSQSIRTLVGLALVLDSVAGFPDYTMPLFNKMSALSAASAL